jgi:hypothetical protein
MNWVLRIYLKRYTAKFNMTGRKSPTIKVRINGYPYVIEPGHTIGSENYYFALVVASMYIWSVETIKIIITGPSTIPKKPNIAIPAKTPSKVSAGLR